MNLLVRKEKRQVLAESFADYVTMWKVLPDCPWICRQMAERVAERMEVEDVGCFRAEQFSYMGALLNHAEKLLEAREGVSSP